MRKRMLWEITIVALVFLGGGCSIVSEEQWAGEPWFSGKSESVKWVNAGTLVSVGPALEATRPSSQLESDIFGDTKLTRTRVETTDGVYLVSEKIAVVEIGIPVTVGYKPSGKYPDRPSYLVLRDRQYKVER